MVADLKSGNLDNIARVVDDTVKPELDSWSKDGSLSGLREDIEAVKSAGREATAAEADKNHRIKA